jgi:hypothetical protein
VCSFLQKVKKMLLNALKLQDSQRLLLFFVLYKHFRLFNASYCLLFGAMQLHNFFFKNKPRRQLRATNFTIFDQLQLKSSNRSQVFKSNQNLIPNYEYQLTQFFFLLNFRSINNFFYLNHEYSLLGIQQFKSFLTSSGVIFFTRWRQGTTLLYSLFYLEPRSLLLGTEFFMRETCAYNWNFFDGDLIFWKYSKNYLFLKTNRVNQSTQSFYRKLKKKKIDCVFVYDAYYHFKNLYYLNKGQFFTIGLSHQRINPWLFSYVFIVLNDSLISQLLFLSLLNLSKKVVLKSVFLIKKFSWYLNISNTNLSRILL